MITMAARLKYTTFIGKTIGSLVASNEASSVWFTKIVHIPREKNLKYIRDIKLVI